MHGCSCVLEFVVRVFLYMRGLPSIFFTFSNKFINLMIQEHFVDSTYHMTLKLLLNRYLVV